MLKNVQMILVIELKPVHLFFHPIFVPELITNLIKGEMKNGIVIPCYNESDRLKFDEFENFINHYDNYTICFVNDGSSDNTIEKLNEFRKGREEKVHVYDLVKNQGKAEAVRQGMKYLLDSTDVEFLGFIDADLSTGFNDYMFLEINLVQAEDPNYMVFGSRKLSNESNIERSYFRKIASSVVGFSIDRVLALPIMDTQCGAKIFTRKLAKVVFEKSFLTRWLFDVEIFLRMKNLYGKNVMKKLRELPLSNWTDVEGSKLSFMDSIKIPMMLYKIALNYFISHQIEKVNMKFRNNFRTRSLVHNL